eukprot:6184477-Pleurochrysis_carterae.AAC.1
MSSRSGSRSYSLLMNSRIVRWGSRSAGAPRALVESRAARRRDGAQTAALMQAVAAARKASPSQCTAGSPIETAARAGAYTIGAGRLDRRELSAQDERRPRLPTGEGDYSSRHHARSVA